MNSKMTPQELEQAHKEASALHTALTGFDDNGQPATASEDTAPTGAGDCSVLVASLEHVSTQWVQLHQAMSEALGLEFLADEDIERYTEAIAAKDTELASLRAQVAALTASLVAVVNETNLHQSDWAEVERLYAPEWTHPYKDIGDIATEGFKKAQL